MKRLVAASLLVLCVGSPLLAKRVGAPAPRFQALEKHRGQIVFINFWASWCAPCQQELPELARLAKAYRAQGVRVLAINVDTDRGAAKAVIKKFGLTATPIEIVWDTHSKVIGRYNAPTMPSSYIVDKRGIVRYIHEGYHPGDPAAWRSELDLLLRQ